MKPILCPKCGYYADASAHVGWRGDTGLHVPRPGDFNICLGCGEIQVFQSDMSVRLALALEIDALPEETRTLLLKAKVARVLVIERLGPPTYVNKKPQ